MTNHYYATRRALSAAQATWDNASPPEGGPSDCPDCGGRGSCPAEDPNDEWEECETCEGTGQVGEDGDPWFEAEDDGERL